MKSSQAGRNAQLVRILSILRELDRLGGVDIYELARKYGTTARTIRRDFDALRDAGITLEEEQVDDGPRKKWKVALGTSLAKLTKLLDVDHYVALRMAMEQGRVVHSESMLFASLEDLADKIEASLGPADRVYLEMIEKCVLPLERQAYRQAPPDLLWPLARAIHERFVCRLEYHPPRSPPTTLRFELLPLRVLLHSGATYLIGAFSSGDIRTFNLHRVGKLEVLDQRREPPKDFDPRAWENAAFGIVADGPTCAFRLRFKKWAAPYIRERSWHPTQSIRDLRGGSIELTFTCVASYEVSAWVASWRDAVVVIEPNSLREELAQLGAWFSKTYEGVSEERDTQRPVEKRHH